jgi:TolB protein
MDPNTGTPVQLTYLKDSEALTPSWSPDSHLIAFVSNGSHRFTLWTVPAAGGAPREIRITRLRYRYPVGTLDASILDEKGKQTAAQVYLEGSDGRSWAPEGAFQRCSNFTGDYYFQTEGGFSVEVPTGTATIEAVKGFEYYPGKQTVQIRQGSSTRVTLRLKRMTDFAARGWYSGDNHVHMNYGGVFRETPASLLGEMEAEDLNVVNALVANEQNHLVDMQYFIGRPDPHSTSNRILYFNEEYRPAFAGHLDLLNLKKLFFPFYDGSAGTPFAADFPSNAQVLDSVHSQGGVGGFAHPYEIPLGKDPSEAGYAGAREFPADAALGKVDFYDLMSVWTDKFVAAKVWYRLLNLGLRIPISAGSDVMANYWRSPTVGSVRVYVHTGPKLSYQRYIETLLEGHSFVTNGPLLSLTVNGREPGDQIDLPAGSTAPLWVDADAQSIVPMAELDIIENGRVVYAQKAATPEHIHASTSLKVSGSAWIAARVTGPSKQHLLMDSYVYAHTNPVYVREAGSSMRSPGDAEYFVRWMDGVLHLIDGRTFDNPEQKTEVREVYQKARARFEHLAAAR